MVLIVALLACYAVAGLALQRIARRSGIASIWAWLPPLNLLLPFKVAGRSLMWGLLLLIPPLNFVVWTLAWAEVCGALGRPRRLALGMPVPFVNLVVLGHLAAFAPVHQGAVLTLVVATLGAAGVADAALERQVCRETVAALDDRSAAGRRRAANAIAGSANGCDVAAALGLALDASDEGVRVAAARALGHLGIRGREAVGGLHRALADESVNVRGESALSLSKLARAGVPTGPAPPAATVLPALLHLARGTIDRLMPDVELVDALASFGPAAVAPLADALQDPDAGVRWHAAGALLQLGPAAHQAALPLRVAMNDEAWVVRNAAGRALEEVVAADAAPLLVDALRDSSPETRYHAARALVRLGNGAAPAVSTLTESLSDGDWEVRLESARALAAAGEAAQIAVPALIDALDDPQPQVRMTVVWSIAKLGGSQARAQQAVRAALDDHDREVRDAAARALAHKGGQL